MTTPNEGVNETSFSEDEAENAFLARWTDAAKPSDTNEGETAANAADEDEGDEDEATILALAAEESDENDDSEDADEDADQSDADDNDDDAGEALVASDDHQVSITVDGEEQTVSVKELKRLFGQEASLTRKSQEVAAARKVADAEGERYMVAAQRLLTKAQERFEPFAKIDWMVAQQKLSADEFAALREEARAAYQDLQFLNAETDDILGQVHQERQANIAEAAKETIATLERDIPGWNRDTYDRVRTHAVEQGMDAEVVNSIVDPVVIKFMHDAMRYRELKAKAATKKTTKPKAAPKKVVKPATQTPGKMGTKTKAEDALTKLRKSGDADDAVAALMAGWSENGDDA